MNAPDSDPHKDKTDSGSSRDAARLRWLLTRPDMEVAGTHDRDGASRGEAPIEFPRPDEIADLDRPIVIPERRVGRNAAIAAMCVALVVAIGAYAGGAEFVYELFDDDSVPTSMNISSTASVHIDSSMSPADSIMQAEHLATFGEPVGDTIRRAAFGTASSARYVLQVRATESRTEAEKLATQLGAKGARNVTVTTAQKDGHTMYRVRYGAFDNVESARTTASALGHGDAWVVRQ